MEPELKPSSRVARARGFLQAIGRTATVDEILTGIGEDSHPANRHGLVCQLNFYVRKNVLFTRPRCNEFGLLAKGATAERSAPALSLSAEDLMRGHARLKVHRALMSGLGVMTPAGIVLARPTVCQWCKATPPANPRKNSPIRAFHYLGFGNKTRDLTAIFVCDTCSRWFQTIKDAVRVIAERFSGLK